MRVKLAEALILRADCQTRVEQLRERLETNAKVQEGETPAEDPKELLQELDECVTELTTLIKRINKTNVSVAFDDVRTLADALADRDMLALKRSVLESLNDEAGMRHNRYSRSEIKYTATVNVVELQKQMDHLAKQYRELDMNIQATNWRTELV
ncbi:DIP1984 family protein [Numidum massiliense]|uniref:DIP1984 family protein n=1 Tax=Numidum massiliense TaxID=1522315 RepID=UPI0028FC802C|nr:DIP1984 family protein [Numidum massiliense]